MLWFVDLFFEISKEINAVLLSSLLHFKNALQKLIFIRNLIIILKSLTTILYFRICVLQFVAFLFLEN